MRSTGTETPRVARTGRRLLAAALVACGGAAGAQAQPAAAESRAVVAAPADAGPAASAAAPAPPSASVADTGMASAGDRATRIERSARALRDDPLLSGKHKTHELQWKSDEPDEPDGDVDPSWLQWMSAFARFLSDASRFLVYGVAIVLAALLLVSARHMVQLRAFSRRAKAASAVSHVRDLDVRPESLPDDVGGAAWTLWQAGQVRAALSLLYRGALSRLIHRHGVPIEAATTEGECLALARDRVDPAALRYLTQVVRAWEAHIYGNRALSNAMGEALCTGFASRLDAPATPPDADAPTPAGAAR